MKKKVGFLLNDIAFGGAAKSIFLLIRNLNQNDFEIIIYTNAINSEEFYLMFERLNIIIKKVDIPLIQCYKWASTNYLRYIYNMLIDVNWKKRFINEILNDNIYILHVNSTTFAFVPKLVKKYCNIRIIFHVREIINSKTILGKYALSNISHFSDVIICISDNEKKLFTDSDNLHVLPNPVEDIGINYDIIESEKIYITSLTSTHKYKNPILFLKIIKQFLIYNPNSKYKFFIVGINSPCSYLKCILKSIVRLSLYELRLNVLLKNPIVSPNIEVINRVKDVQKILSKTKLYIRTDGMPWGRDVIEAMAMGIPVIANGTSEFYVKNGITGILLNSNNPVLFVHEIIKLLNDNSKYKEFSDACIRNIRLGNGIIEYVRKIESIYNNEMLLLRYKSNKFLNDKKNFFVIHSRIN